MHLPPADVVRERLRPTLGFAAFFGVCAAVVWMFEPPPCPIVVASLVLGGVLALLSGIDMQTYRLPNILTLPLLVAGLGAAWLLDLAPIWWRVVSAAIGWGLLWAVAVLYERARGTAGLGLGDAKLLGAGAAWIGAEGIPTTLLVAAGSALVMVVGARLAGRAIHGGTKIPFGPFLGVGIWVVWLLGPL